MRAQTVAQSPSNHRRTIIRRSWPIVLATLLVLAAIVYGLVSRLAVPSPTARSSYAANVDPATQRVLDIVQPLSRAARLLDPGQQAVMDYLRAHGVEQTESPAPWDPAVQTVFDYLRAHGR